MGISSSTQPGGFRILKIIPGSPADQANLEIFFDFIVELEDYDLTYFQPDCNQIFANLIQKSQGDLHFVIYNTRTRTYRDTYVKPIQQEGKTFLGASVQHEPFSNATTQGVRVLAVHQNSPAEQAGLSSYKDYLISSEKGPLTGYEDLSDLTSDNFNKSMILMVYNSSNEDIRTIKIKPNLSWGGSTCLGCDVAVGYLNQIPLSRSSNISDIDIVKKLPRVKSSSSTEHMLSQKSSMPKKITMEVYENITNEPRKEFSENESPDPHLDEEQSSEISDHKKSSTDFGSTSIQQEEPKANENPLIEGNPNQTQAKQENSLESYYEYKANEQLKNKIEGGLCENFQEVKFTFKEPQDIESESSKNETFNSINNLKENETLLSQPELGSEQDNKKLLV